MAAQPADAKQANVEEPGEGVAMATMHFAPHDTEHRGGFNVSVAELCDLVEHGEEEKNKRKLASLGGAPGLAACLKSSVMDGISGSTEDLDSRREMYVKMMHI